MTLGRWTPFAVTTMQGAWGAPAEVMSFYGLWRKGVRGQAVRRVSWSGTSQERVQWATTHECPKLQAVISRIETIPGPRVETTLIGPIVGGPPPVDGTIYGLWSAESAWTGGAAGYSVEMSSNVGTPLAVWIEAARTATRNCWTDREPVES